LFMRIVHGRDDFHGTRSRTGKALVTRNGFLVHKASVFNKMTIR
jgi:hypothetical protein